MLEHINQYWEWDQNLEITMIIGHLNKTESHLFLLKNISLAHQVLSHFQIS